MSASTSSTSRRTRDFPTYNPNVAQLASASLPLGSVNPAYSGAATVDSLLQPASHNPTAQSWAAWNRHSSPAPANNIVDVLRNLTSQNLQPDSALVNALLNRTSTNTAPGMLSVAQQAPISQPQNPGNVWDINTVLQLSSSLNGNHAYANLLTNPGSLNPYLQSALFNSTLNGGATLGLGSHASHRRVSIDPTNQNSFAAPAGSLQSLIGLSNSAYSQQHIASLALSGLTNPSVGFFNRRGENGLPPPAETPWTPSSLTAQLSSGRGEYAQATSAGLPSVVALCAAAADQATPTSDAATTGAQHQEELEAGPPVPSDSDSFLLYTPNDDNNISPYQCLARQQLEFFVVGQDDLEAGAQGRNRPIVLGQVGIR
jgi:hypothetical protein